MVVAIFQNTHSRQSRRKLSELAFVCLLQIGDDDLLHLEHGVCHSFGFEGCVFHADTEPYARKSEMTRRPEPASTIAAAPNPIEFLYASDGASPFSDAVTSENSMPWPATATVWPSLDLAMLSRQRVPRTAACDNDSLLGRMKSWSAHAFFSSAAYSGCGIPDSSADHSLRQGRFEIESPNTSARMMALSMLRRNGLAKTAAGRLPGHAPARLRICSSPRRERGARSKVDVYGGRTNSPWRTRTKVAVTRARLRRRRQSRGSTRHRGAPCPRGSVLRHE